MIRYYLTCIFLFAAFSIKAQFQKADSLFENKNYRLAKIEYERVAYITNEEQLRNEAYLRGAYCLKQLEKFEEAQKNLERVSFRNMPDSTLFKFRYEAALCSFLASHFNEAYHHIQYLKNDVKDSSLTDQILFLEIMTLNEMGNWAEGKKLLNRYIQINHLNINAEELYEGSAGPKLKNQYKAEVLATFLPGTGQIYAGYPGKGIFSFTLQAGALAYGIYSIYNGYYFTGILTGFGLFQTFYFGGIRHTHFLIEEENQKRRHDYNKRIKNFIVAQEKNLK